MSATAPPSRTSGGSSAGDRKLAPAVVHVGMTSVSDMNDDIRAACCNRLAPDELLRVARIVSPASRDQFMVARLLLRTVLSRTAGVRFGEWRFLAEPGRKPRVAGPPEGLGMQFNLSHTDGLVVCAVSDSLELGIDVENTRCQGFAHSLYRKVLAPHELEVVSRAAPGDRHRLFCGFWTLKEAYAKALGVGMSIPFDAFGFDLRHATPRIVFSPQHEGDSTRWQFRQLPWSRAYEVALAVSNPSGRELDIRIANVMPGVEGVAAGSGRDDPGRR